MTFEARGTNFDKIMPALGIDRAAKREREYQAYRARKDVHGQVVTFGNCLDSLRLFVAPLLRYDMDGAMQVWENGRWTAI